MLVAAHRADHPQHERGRTTLGDLVGSSGPFAVTDGAAGSFVRIVTNIRIFRTPTPLADAFDFLRAVRAQANHRQVAPGPRHLALFEGLATAAEATGDLAPDAQLAAIAIEHDAELVSFDRDFARFDELRWSVPE